MVSFDNSSLVCDLGLLGFFVILLLDIRELLTFYIRVGKIFFRVLVLYKSVIFIYFFFFVLLILIGQLDM